MRICDKFVRICEDKYFDHIVWRARLTSHNLQQNHTERTQQGWNKHNKQHYFLLLLFKIQGKQEDSLKCHVGCTFVCCGLCCVCYKTASQLCKWIVTRITNFLWDFCLLLSLPFIAKLLLSDQLLPNISNMMLFFLHIN